MKKDGNEHHLHKKTLRAGASYEYHREEKSSNIKRTAWRIAQYEKTKAKKQQLQKRKQTITMERANNHSEHWAEWVRQTWDMTLRTDKSQKESETTAGWVVKIILWELKKKMKWFHFRMSLFFSLPDTILLHSSSSFYFSSFPDFFRNKACKYNLDKLKLCTPEEKTTRKYNRNSSWNIYGNIPEWQSCLATTSANTERALLKLRKNNVQKK